MLGSLKRSLLLPAAARHLHSYQWYVNGAPIDQTESEFSFAPASAGTYTIYATVTDSSSTTSAPSNTATVTVSASPTVSIAPVGPLTLTAGQGQTFTATPSGGSGTISYHWYLDGSAVGTNIATTPTPPQAPHIQLLAKLQIALLLRLLLPLQTPSQLQ